MAARGRVKRNKPLPLFIIPASISTKNNCCPFFKINVFGFFKGLFQILNLLDEVETIGEGDHCGLG
tara:strand:- start:517 stop:714 length:198 start_codon:yes stop_codon:yes gene_type:complete